MLLCGVCMLDANREVEWIRGKPLGIFKQGNGLKRAFLRKSDNSWGFWLAASGSLLTKSSKASAVNKSIPGHSDLLTVT